MVRKAIRAVVIAAVLALPLLLVSGGAGAGTTPGIDLSSPAAIKSYLTSIGVDPATVTWQSGLNNYAGPNCPGVGWNCTTSTKVVQMSDPGGQNKFECQPAYGTTDPSTNTCVIMQSGENNKARCKIRDTAEPTSTETCQIGQDGRRNSADVDMTTDQGAGPTQAASQDAEIKQKATDRNQAQVDQTIDQGTSTGSSQSQDGYQLANVSQTVTGSDNFSHVHQSLDQSESGNATTQNQNTNAQPVCFSKNANQCAMVKQTVSDPNGGDNQSHLEQAIGERENTGASGASQTQGDFSNGQEGVVHLSNPTGVGENHDTAHETLAQREVSPAGVFSQKQTTDPTCCGHSEVGGEINRENIDEATTQSASDPNADQFSDLFGQAHQMQPDPPSAPTAPSTTSPDNRCSIDQHGRNNSDSGNFSVSGQSPTECANLTLETVCASGVESTGTCGPPLDPSGILVLSLPTSPTLGADIAMPDYTTLPPDYVDPGGWW